MPFTPYHFGPSGFIALTFRKWLDLPVFVLANVVVDVEVLVIASFGLGYPAHRYCHTFLVGGLLGLLWALAAYPFRNLFSRAMRLFRIPYQPSLRKMLISGILGVWLHVLIDGLYHFDVRMFWPWRTVSLRIKMYNSVAKEQVEAACLVFFLAAIVPYALAVRSFLKQKQNP